MPYQNEFFFAVALAVEAANFDVLDALLSPYARPGSLILRNASQIGASRSWCSDWKSSRCHRCFWRDISDLAEDSALPIF